MRILFVSLYNDEAYGLRILHSLVKNKGYDSRMLFLKRYSPKTPLTDKERELFYEEIRIFNPDLLAFSLVSPNFCLYQSLYPTLRKLGNFKIVIGGWQASLNPIETIRYCDFLCVGEGEEAILDLIKSLELKKSIYNIKNIWYKIEDLIIEHLPRPLSHNLNIPFVFASPKSIACIDDNQIIYNDPYKTNMRYGTSIGRGCPFHCTYCSNSFMANKIYPGEWSKIRYRSVDNVIEELKIAKSTFPLLKQINFYDEIFMPQASWVDEFFDKYKQEINLPFYCMFFPGTCKEDLLKIMIKAGLAGVWMGVQSGSERVRKEVFKRYYTNQTVLKQTQLFSDYKISAKYDFIFDNPFETPEETEDTYKLMAQIPEPKSFNFFSLKFFPNTELTDMALQAGFITKKDLDDQLAIESPRYEVSEERKKEILTRVKSYVL